MKNKFKLLCILLSLVVICSALIISVSANENYGIASYVNNKGETAEASFEDAMLRAKPGTTVTLLGDCSFSSAFYVNKRLELDLNGYTLKSTAENAFIFEEAYSLTVKGSGAIDIEGKLVHSQTPSLDFKFTVWGTEGTIDINHSGSLSPKIAETLGGILTFRNVDITSISAGGSNIDAFFYVGANAKGANILFDSMTFYCDKNPTIQNQYIFLLLGGTDTYAKIYNSTILNGGTLLYYGFNNAKNADTVLTDIENSHLEVISQNNSVRSVLIWCHLQDGGNIELYGTVNLKNSYIGGNVYRAVHSNNQEINSLNGKSYGYDRFKVILDNSIIANNGANDADATKKGVDQDTLITRGALVYLKNGSVLVSGNASLQNGGQIKAEEGTRFNTTVVANSGQITWVDANGSDIKKPQIALDIKGNLTYPVIASNDAIDSALAGASSAEFYTMSYASGFGSNSDYGYHVDTNSINEGLTEHSTIIEAVPKRGAFTSVTYGNNTAFKYWISPNAEYSLGDIEKLTTDPLFILGDNNLYSGEGYRDAFAPIGTDGGKTPAKVAVFDMDIATDSQYGYPQINLFVMTRTTTDGNAGPKSIFGLESDGTITQRALVGGDDSDESAKFSLDSWNHLTVVVYTDATIDGETVNGRAYVYLNGTLLGYVNLGKTSGYIQGIRFEVRKTQQTVGSSILVDNVARRAYTAYPAASGESDGSAKNPAYYIIPELLGNKSPTNRAITVLGKEYKSIEEAYAAAISGSTKDILGNAVVTLPELNDNVPSKQSITSDISIMGNGYVVNATDSSYGYVIDGNKYTFGDGFECDVYWYSGDISKLQNGEAVTGDDFSIQRVKLGHDVINYPFSSSAAYNWTDFTQLVQNGWSYSYNGEKLESLVAGKENVENPIYVYPTTSAYELAYYVKGESGPYYGGVNSSEVLSVLKDLKDKDTLVLLSDVTASTAAGASVADATVSFDLNGHKYIQTVNGTIAWVKSGGTLNVYSSRPGGLISVSAEVEHRTFGIDDKTSSGSTSDPDTTQNAHLNIGAYTENGVIYPGSNLTIESPIVADLLNGNSTCSLTIDGATLVGNVGKNGMIISRSFSGSITINNATIIHHGGEHIFGIANTNKSELSLSTTVIVSNSVIIVKNAGKDIFSQGISDSSSHYLGTGDENATITFENVITNASLGVLHDSSNTSTYGTHGKVIIGEGCVYAGILGDVIYAEGVNQYKYNANVAVSEGHYLVVNDPMANQDVYVIEYGYDNLVDVPEDAKTIILPVAPYSTAKETDKATVTFSDIAGNTITDYYAPGGNVSAYSFDDFVGEMITLRFIGGFNEPLKAGVEAGASYSYVAQYEIVTKDVLDAKVSVGFESDFRLNLYIPASYKDYLNTELFEKVNKDGVEYYKTSVVKYADSVSDTVEFAVEIKENLAGKEYSQIITVSASILDYAKVIFEGEYEDADKTLVYYALNYANEASKYFNGSYDEAVSEVLSEYSKYAAKYTPGLDYKYTGVENASPAIESVNLVLEEKVYLAVKFREGLEGSLRVKIGTGYKNYDSVPNESMIIELPISDVLSEISFTVKKDDQTVAKSTVSVVSYAKYHMDNSKAEDSENPTDVQLESAKCIDILEALCEYAKIAELYADEVTTGEGDSAVKMNHLQFLINAGSEKQNTAA